MIGHPRPESILCVSKCPWAGIGGHLEYMASIAATNPTAEIRFTINYYGINGNLFDVLFDYDTIKRHSSSLHRGKYDRIIECADLDSFPKPYGTNRILELDDSTAKLIKVCKRLNFRSDLVDIASLKVDRKKGERILGVHYRGTDKITELPRIPYGHIFGRIDHLKSSYDKILICTDENLFLEKVPLKDYLYFKSHIRSSQPRSDDYVYGLHHTGLGLEHVYEAVIEIIALGMCDHIVISRSCFAVAALIHSTQRCTWEYYY